MSARVLIGPADMSHSYTMQCHSFWRQISLIHEKLVGISAHGCTYSANLRKRFSGADTTIILYISNHLMLNTPSLVHFWLCMMVFTCSQFFLLLPPLHVMSVIMSCVQLASSSSCKICSMHACTIQAYYNTWCSIMYCAVFEITRPANLCTSWMYKGEGWAVHVMWLFKMASESGWPMDGFDEDLLRKLHSCSLTTFRISHVTMYFNCLVP